MSEKIDTLILLAGPSGAGKTTVARSILDGHDPEGVHLDRSLDWQRIDIKLFDQSNPPTGNVILEYATNAFDEGRNDIPNLLGLIKRSKKTYIYTIQVDRKEIAWRYIAQMFEAKGRRTPKWARVFQARKWYRFLRYRYSNDTHRYHSNWFRFLQRSVLSESHVSVLTDANFVRCPATINPRMTQNG